MKSPVAAEPRPAKWAQSCNVEPVGPIAPQDADVTTLNDFKKKIAALRFLDLACGSGSFLIRAFERTGEGWQKRLTADLREAGPSRCDDRQPQRNRPYE